MANVHVFAYILKPGACPPNAWFLSIAFVREVRVCIRLTMCVHP